MHVLLTTESRLLPLLEASIAQLNLKNGYTKVSATAPLARKPRSTKIHKYSIHQTKQEKQKLNLHTCSTMNKTDTLARRLRSTKIHEYSIHQTVQKKKKERKEKKHTHTH